MQHIADYVKNVDTQVIAISTQKLANNHMHGIYAELNGY